MFSKSTTSTSRPLELSEIVAEWQKPIYHFALCWLRDESDAADATQDIFVRVIRGLPQLESDEKFRPWIFTIARHVLIKRSEQIKKRQAREVSMSLVETVSEGDSADQKSEQRLIKEAVTALPQLYRQVIELSYFVGLTQHEISELLDKSRSTIQSQLNKALSLLKSSLQTSFGCVVVPDVVELLGKVKHPDLPSHLSTSLSGLSEASKPAVSGLSVLKGSIVVQGKTSFMAVVAVFIGLGGGFMTGQAFLPARIGRDREPRMAHGSGHDIALLSGAVSRKQTEKVKKANQPARSKGLKDSERRAENKRLKSQLRALKEQLGKAQKKLKARVQTPKGAAPGFAKLVDELVDLSVEHQRRIEQGRSIEDLMPRYVVLIEKLHKNPEQTTALLTDRLTDPGSEMRGDPKRALVDFVWSLKPTAEQQSRLNQYIFDSLADKKESVKIRLQLLKSSRAGETAEDINAYMAAVVKAEQGVKTVELRQELVKIMARSTDVAAANRCLELLIDAKEAVSIREVILQDMSFSSLPEATKYLFPIVKSDEEELRCAALSSLASFDKSAAVLEFIEPLISNEGYYTKHLKAALLKHGDRGTLEKLAELMNNKQLPLEQRKFGKEMGDLLKKVR